jgi:hypothetical protein
MLLNCVEFIEFNNKTRILQQRYIKKKRSKLGFWLIAFRDRKKNNTISIIKYIIKRTQSEYICLFIFPFIMYIF